jgi:hypothetical protein
MTNKLGIRDFDINLTLIPTEIEKLDSYLPNERKKVLENYYVSAHDFLIILFHLRFIEKLHASEIAHRLHLRPTGVDIHLYNFAWNYSTDYAENQRLYNEFLAKARVDLTEAENTSILLDENENPTLRLALERAKKIQIKTYTDLGFETAEEYARVLYYLVKQKNYSATMLGHLFNLTYNTVHQRLQRLGLNVSLQEGVRNKKLRASQNYEKSIRHGRITQTKAQLQNFSKGSKNEDYFRSQLAKMIYDRYIPSQEYEVIVGLSNIGILGSLEIDIPLMVYDIKRNLVYRFAIEYNGNYFHADEERDRSKRLLCEKKGWHYLTITDSGQYSNKPELLDPVLQSTCEKIKNIVFESDALVISSNN